MPGDIVQTGSPHTERIGDPPEKPAHLLVSPVAAQLPGTQQVAPRILISGQLSTN